MTGIPATSMLDAVADLARLVGGTALTHFRTALRTEYKADGSPVTAADRGAEQVAREWLTLRFPRDGVLGEEFGELRPGAVRRWIVDPIDGTKSFVRGVPLWGSLVAVCEGSEVLAGAAYFPAIDEMLVAAPGQGCWWNGARCRVSECADLGAATVLTTDERFAGQPDREKHWHTLAARAALARSWGDCVGYLLVATGRAEVMVDPVLATWDAAPFLPIVTEAGGVFTDWSGAARIDGGSAIATNRRLAGPARVLLECPVDQHLMEMA